MPSRQLTTDMVGEMFLSLPSPTMRRGLLEKRLNGFVFHEQKVENPPIRLGVWKVLGILLRQENGRLREIKYFLTCEGSKNKTG
jgi:hypothetical protein